MSSRNYIVFVKTLFLDGEIYNRPLVNTSAMMYEFHYKQCGLCNLKLLEIQQVVNSGCDIVKDGWIVVVQLICVVEYSRVSRELPFFN